MGWNGWIVISEDDFLNYWNKCYKLVIVFIHVNLNQMNVSRNWVKY